jgi:hypothetical protein
MPIFHLRFAVIDNNAREARELRLVAFRERFGVPFELSSGESVVRRDGACRRSFGLLERQGDLILTNKRLVWWEPRYWYTKLKANPLKEIRIREILTADSGSLLSKALDESQVRMRLANGQVERFYLNNLAVSDAWLTDLDKIKST